MKLYKLALWSSLYVLLYLLFGSHSPVEPRQHNKCRTGSKTFFGAISSKVSTNFQQNNFFWGGRRGHSRGQEKNALPAPLRRCDWTSQSIQFHTVWEDPSGCTSHCINRLWIVLGMLWNNIKKCYKNEHIKQFQQAFINKSIIQLTLNFRHDCTSSSSDLWMGLPFWWFWPK